MTKSAKSASAEVSFAKRRRIQSGQRRISSLQDVVDRGDKLMSQVVSLYPEIAKSTKVLNVGTLDGDYLESALDSSHFVRLLDALLECVKILERGSHLIVVCFPLLTRKYVGLLHVFGKNFEEIGFVRPLFGEDAIFFSEFRGFDADSVDALSDIRYACLKDAMEADQVVEVLDVSRLTVEPLYDLVFSHNVNVLKFRGLSLLTDQVDSEREAS